LKKFMFVMELNKNLGLLQKLIAAYLDMSGQELESTADGSALAEVFEGKTLTEVAEELEKKVQVLKI
jgi:hypothetical protein